MSFFVHERAICDTSSVGDDTRIWAFTHVLKGARIGARCNLGEHVFVEGEVIVGDGCTIKNGVALWNLVTLEDQVFIGPYVVFTNDFVPRAFMKGQKHYRPTLVKRGASIGANATIVCGITVGAYALVGAGAVVTHDIPDHGLVIGNPARLVGNVCFCGVKVEKGTTCGECKPPAK